MGKLPHRKNIAKMGQTPPLKNKTRYDRSLRKINGKVHVEALNMPMGFQGW
jgi:hypothetical protein